MRSWKTTLGGACSALGTFLMGIGIVPSLTNVAAAEELKWLVISGFVLQGIGNFFAHLFSVDQVSVGRIVEKALNGHGEEKP